VLAAFTVLIAYSVHAIPGCHSAPAALHAKSEKANEDAGICTCTCDAAAAVVPAACMTSRPTLPSHGQRCCATFIQASWICDWRQLHANCCCCCCCCCACSLRNFPAYFAKSQSALLCYIYTSKLDIRLATAACQLLLLLLCLQPTRLPCLLCQVAVSAAMLHLQRKRKSASAGL
jgi:hypothetical protein